MSDLLIIKLMLAAMMSYGMYKDQKDGDNVPVLTSVWTAWFVLLVQYIVTVLG